MAISRGLWCCQRLLAWIPVLIISMVVLWSYYAYVFELCVFTVRNGMEKAAYLVIFHLFFVLFVWTYCKAIFTEPAQPSRKFQLTRADRERYEREENPEVQKQILLDVAKTLPVYTKTASGAIRYCDRCQLIKPDRCHHCSICDTCVLKMDHHCPWVNNCIGFSNYKFFLLFLGYSMLYSLFVAATVLQYFIMFWTGGLPDGPAKFHVLFLLFVAVMFFLSLMFLLSYHCWLVSLNRSTLEAFSAPIFQHGPDKNGYNLGTRKNLEHVFGPEKKYWLLPIFTSIGDGHFFPMKSQSESHNPLLSNNEHWDEGDSDVDYYATTSGNTSVTVEMES
ncbi:palmitoyltransferase ZDHHC15B isoform X1 [Mobula hypostoma]|uniref:palmitoyltransferase ZDHHC15B isoform X1 n=2 Tax=Mobula hypostoma TaxID=723540 RepID=UPI002FC38659